MIAKIPQFYKALISSLIAGLTALGTAVADGHVSGQEWVGIALAVLVTPLGVAVVTNAPTIRAAMLREQVSEVPELHATTPGPVEPDWPLAMSERPLVTTDPPVVPSA